MHHDSNIDYRIKREARKVINTSFSKHLYTDPSLAKQHRAWTNGGRMPRSFKQYNLMYWPYRYWLILGPEVDCDTLTKPCVFNLPLKGFDVPYIPSSQRLVGYRRQQDRNKDAKRNWGQVIGWAGGHFVY